MRIKIILIIVIMLLCNPCFAQQSSEQQNRYFSFESFFIFPYYFFIDAHHYTYFDSKFNYGFGVELSENFNKFKITSGIYFTTKKYSEPFESTDAIEQITYSLNYFNVPILVGFPLSIRNKKKHYFLINTGIVFNIPRNYQSKTFYKNGNQASFFENPHGYKAGSSFHLGIQFHRKINSFINVYGGAFGDYKFKLESISFTSSIHTPQWHTAYSEDKFLAGINIGLEWILKGK